METNIVGSYLMPSTGGSIASIIGSGINGNARFFLAI